MPPKIQPIDIEPARSDYAKPVLKSRLKRLFDRQFPGVLRNNNSSADKEVGKDGEFEPSSVCLAKMVQNFIEENNEKQSAAKCGRNRCNCFNGNNNGSSDDELDIFDGFSEFGTIGPSGDSADSLKVLIPCSTVVERNLLADTAKIVEKNKTHKQKDDLKTIVVDNLSALGYDSSICKAKWEKTPLIPAGEYEYIDVIVDGERLLIDVDFRSEFEIARSTSAYKTMLQSLPYVFVGKADRLGQIVTIVSEAARQSLKKKGMHIAPWRKSDYMRAKWLSPYTRAVTAAGDAVTEPPQPTADGEIEAVVAEQEEGELKLIFGEEPEPAVEATAATPTVEPSPPPSTVGSEPGGSWPTWQPPAIKPKSIDRGSKVVTGLASLLTEKP